MMHSLLDILSALIVRGCRGLIRPHRRAPPPNYSKTSRFPGHPQLRQVGRSDLTRQHRLLLLRASLGPTPSEIFCFDRCWRRLLRIAGGCFGGCCWRLLRIAGYYDTEGGGCDRLDPRQWPCLTALLYHASLTIPTRPPCCYPFALLGLLGRGERWSWLGSRRKSCQTEGAEAPALRASESE